MQELLVFPLQRSDHTSDPGDCAFYGAWLTAAPGSASVYIVADTNVYVSSFQYLQCFVTHMGPGQGAVADLTINLEVMVVVPHVGEAKLQNAWQTRLQDA